MNNPYLCLRRAILPVNLNLNYLCLQNGLMFLVATEVMAAVSWILPPCCPEIPLRTLQEPLKSKPMKDRFYIDALIEAADNLPYMVYCRLLSVIRWQLLS